MRLKILKYISIAILILVMVISIGLWIYPVQDWNKTLNNEGFWFYVRVFAPMIGAAIGAFAAYYVAIKIFEKNKQKEEDKDKFEKKILRKRIQYALYSIVGSFCHQFNDFRLARLSILDDIKNKKIIKLQIPITVIPFSLITDISGNDLFKILIMDNNITDPQTIALFNAAYSFILTGDSIIGVLQKHNQHIIEMHNIFTESFTNSSEKLMELQHKELIPSFSKYWAVIEKTEIEGFSEEKTELLRSILREEIIKIDDVNVRQILKEINNSIKFKTESYFDSMNQIATNLFENEKLKAISIFNLHFVMKHCFTEIEYNDFIEFLKTSFNIDILDLLENFNT